MGATKMAQLYDADRVMFEDKFALYDLDGSGTINSPEEFKQISVNIGFSLGITEGLPVLVQAGAAMPPEACMDLEEYAAWFLTTFDIQDNRREGGGIRVLG